MNLRPVVKLMNFHALMRVDSAKRRADKHVQLEERISDLLDLVMNNRNFIYDKHILRPDESKPPLRIYLGSDFGFCGPFNNRINNELLSDTESEKIVIGRKLFAEEASNVLFACDRADYDENYEDIRSILVERISHRRCSRIDIVFNRYFNISQIEEVKQNIFPLDKKEKPQGREDSSRYNDDFLIEGDVTELLINLIVTFIDYELRIAIDSSFASENILRQGITTESLEKIEERELTRLVAARKLRRHKEFLKVIDTYSKMGQNV